MAAYQKPQGINKDTSARKTTTQPAMHSALEVAAIRASHEAYIESMTSGYDAQIAALKAEQDDQIESLKATHSKEKNELIASQQRLIDRAVAQAHQRSKVTNAQLMEEKKTLAREKQDLQSSLDEQILINRSTSLGIYKREVSQSLSTENGKALMRITYEYRTNLGR